MEINKAKALRIARNAAQKMGLAASKVRPSELILFAGLNSNENRYEFSLEHGEAQKVLKLAKGLLDRDAFVAVGMAIGVLPVPVINSREYPTAAAPVYWEDSGVFTEPAGAGHDLSESQALASIFWGYHTIQTNEGVRIDRASNIHFRTVQETQGSASTDNMQTGLEVKSIGAAVRFGGGDENRIIIDIASLDKTLIGGPAARNNYLMIRLTGGVIKGSSTKLYTR